MCPQGSTVPSRWDVSPDDKTLEDLYRYGQVGLSQEFPGTAALVNFFREWTDGVEQHVGINEVHRGRGSLRRRVRRGSAFPVRPPCGHQSSPAPPEAAGVDGLRAVSVSVSASFPSAKAVSPLLTRLRRNCCTSTEIDVSSSMARIRTNLWVSLSMDTVMFFIGCPYWNRDHSMRLMQLAGGQVSMSEPQCIADGVAVSLVAPAQERLTPEGRALGNLPFQWIMGTGSVQLVIAWGRRSQWKQ